MTVVLGMIFIDSTPINWLGSDTINESDGGVDTLDFSSTTGQAIVVGPFQCCGSAAAQTVTPVVDTDVVANATIEDVIGGALNDTQTGNNPSFNRLPWRRKRFADGRFWK